MSEIPFTVGILTVPDRSSLLDNLAKSLSTAINCYNGHVEVLVAGEDIGAAADSLDQALPCPVNQIETDGSAPVGRHRLIEAASTEWLLFVDDDCRVEKKLLTTYSNTIQSASSNVAAIYGPLVFEGQRSSAFEAFRFTQFVHPLQIAAWRERVEWAPTANVAFSVSDVRAVGNFDTENPAPVSGEDVDIGLRLNAAGYDLITDSDAKVYHTTKSWNRVVGNIRRVYTYGLSEAWLVQRYPNRTEPVFKLPVTVIMISIISFITLFTIPLVCIVWAFSLWLQKMTTDPTTSLKAYALADIYRAVNYVGFAHETFRGKGAVRNLTRRFVFYRHKYINSQIQQEGVWHEADNPIK